MRFFVIGNDRGDDVLNAQTLKGSHLAIIGNSGSGKSYALRRLLEDSWGQAIHVVFDVEDEFHTLRELYPYVLVGGDHADIPLRMTEAGALARRVLSSQTSVIIQLNDKSIPDRQRYIARFLDALMALRRPEWRPMMIVVDEADKYVPQSATCESSQPIINLMAQGRKRGFIGVLATQRAAKISKSAVSEASNWMIGRVGSTNDRRVAADQLGFKVSAEEMEDLRTLPVGWFWRIGPAFGGRKLEVVGNVRTHHLQLGDDWKVPEIPSWRYDTLISPAETVALRATASVQRVPKPAACLPFATAGMVGIVALVAFLCIKVGLSI